MKTRVYFFTPLELRNHMEDRCIDALCMGPGFPNQGLSHPTVLGLGKTHRCRLHYDLVPPGFWCLREKAAEGEKKEGEHRRFENRSVGFIRGGGNFLL